VVDEVGVNQGCPDPTSNLVASLQVSYHNS
jgi:type VI protein secretion system component VasF